MASADHASRYLRSLFRHLYAYAVGDESFVDEPSLRDIGEWAEGEFELLREHGLAVPLVDLLRRQDFDVSDELSRYYRMRVAGDLALQRVYGDILCRLHAKDVGPVVVQKGVWLANQVYPKSYWRTYADMDLLVEERDMFALDTIVKRAGFRATYSAFPRRERLPNWANRRVIDCIEYKRDFYHVDVHFNLIPHVLPHKVDMDVVWRTVRPQQLTMKGVGGDVDIPIYVLSSYHTVIHLAMHAACHQMENGFRALLDLALALNYFKESWDWETFYERCRLYDVGYLVVGPLELLRCLLYGEAKLIPTDFAARVEPSGKITARYRQGDFIDRFMASPVSLAEGAKDYYTPLMGAGAARVWKAAMHHCFPSPKRMAARYGREPGDPRLYLYYAYRPLQLVGRYLPSILSRR